jgi:hypothetical protein
MTRPWTPILFAIFCQALGDRVFEELTRSLQGESDDLKGKEVWVIGDQGARIAEFARMKASIGVGEMFA